MNELAKKYPEIQAALDGKSEGCIVCADCLDVMLLMPDRCCYIVTDPPYGINEAAGKNKSRGLLAVSKDYGNAKWNAIPPKPEVFKAIKRIGKEAVVFGGNHLADWLGSSPSWIVWDKDNGRTDFADCELAWTSHNKAVRKFKWRWQGMLQEDMANKEVRCHPTQKPLPLMQWVVTNYTPAECVVLDPFCGSGTTCVVAKKLGRRYIGIEIDQNYCDIARDRLLKLEGKSLKKLFKRSGFFDV